MLDIKEEIDKFTILIEELNIFFMDLTFIEHFGKI
jgi:hypothetical protein